MMVDLERLLGRFYAEKGPGSDTARAFLGRDPSIRRYVLGRNQQALNCAARARLDGLVDDFAPANSMWNGLPVVDARSLPAGAVVVNCSTSIRPRSAHQRLASIGIEVLAYADLMRVEPRVPVPAFVASFRADYSSNGERWRALEASLADSESKDVLNDVALFRLTGDYRYMHRFNVRFEEQYFDPLTNLSDTEVFVDCGGFDGDTVLGFLSRVKTFKQIYMFEPSPRNFEKARARLHAIPNVELIPLGVSDGQGVLSFDAESGSASAVSDAGAMSVHVVSIDDYINQPVSYVKMDLEGWELRALHGTRRHITEDHPKLAVAVYHQAPDFWKTFQYIVGLRTDYRIHLRHYSEGWSETVMYFIPEQLSV